MFRNCASRHAHIFGSALRPLHRGTFWDPSAVPSQRAMTVREAAARYCKLQRLALTAGNRFSAPDSSV
eukprot:578191-Alexandrium_andersonii.AAC.1